MPRFAANLGMLFNEVDFLDRFAAAAGFRGVPLKRDGNGDRKGDDGEGGEAADQRPVEKS